MKISTSILNANDRIEAIKKLNKTTTDYIHFDVMDNYFVPNLAFSIKEINDYASVCNKKIDVHFMVERPLDYLKKIDNIKFDNIIVHLEIEDVDNVIDSLAKYNTKIGIAIKPNTNIDLLDKYLDRIDLILVMSVEPGFGGQKFISNTTNRIKEIRKKIGNRNIMISVDGGINDETIKLADVDIAVVGSFITNNDDYQKQIDLLG